MRASLVVLCALVAVPAHADWLAVLPVCGQDAPERSGPTELLYPRPGLVAMVAPGEPLVTRVRVPVPLTPPPGHQQERALRGWSAELRGHDTFAALGAEHRYRLRVADVRPDAHSTLVYRATIQIPPWLAPGTYDLAMSAPWSGETVVIAAVRVVAGAPVFGYLGSGFDAGALRALARLPVDVWWVDTQALDPAMRRALLEEPLVGEGIPWMDRHSSAAVLQTPDGPVVLGGCDDSNLPFDRARVRSVGDVRPRALSGTPAPGRYAIEEEHAYADLAPTVFEEDELSWSGPVGVELSLAVPEDGARTRLQGVRVLGWYPATPLRNPGHRASLVVRVRTTEAIGSATRSATNFSLRIDGEVRPTAGREASFVAHAEGNGMIAWGFTEDGAAFTPLRDGESPLRIPFGQVERQEIHALAISSEGAAARAELAVAVEADEPRGCAVSAPGRGTAPPAAFLVLGALFCTMVPARYARRRSRRE